MNGMENLSVTSAVFDCVNGVTKRKLLLGIRKSFFSINHIFSPEITIFVRNNFFLKDKLIFDENESF